MNNVIITEITKYSLTKAKTEIIQTFYSTKEKATDIWNLYVTSFEQDGRESIYSTEDETLYECSASYQIYDIIYTIKQTTQIINN